MHAIATVDVIHLPSVLYVRILHICIFSLAVTQGDITEYQVYYNGTIINVNSSTTTLTLILMLHHYLMVCLLVLLLSW